MFYKEDTFSWDNYLEKTSSDARKVTEEDFDSQIMKSSKDPRQGSQPSI